MSLVEQSIEAQVILNIEDPILKVDIDSIPTIPFYKIEAIIDLKMDVLPEIYKVYIDLDNINSLFYNDPSSFRFLVRLPIMFIKAVRAHKKTFAKTSLVITNNRTVVGYTNLSGYGSSVYGSGTYPGSTTLSGYGSDVYGSGTYPGSGTNVYGNGVYGSGTYVGNVSVVTKQTTIGEISLASHFTPPQRTNHSLKFRARTISGSIGVIKAALYEGATNRSGDLISISLTNAFADYTLPISDAAAASISSYSNLSIRFWGYDSNGTGLVFEISNVYLELPATVIKQTAISEISLASHGIPSQRTNHSLKFRARTTTGSTGLIKAALYEGATNRSGDLISIALTNVLTDYTLPISDAAAASITSYSDLSIRFCGYDPSGTNLVFELSSVYLELPVV